MVAHFVAGVSKDFFASSGAVTVVGEKWLYVSLARGRSGDSCIQEYPGLAIARCSFKNNTAALTGWSVKLVAVLWVVLAAVAGGATYEAKLCGFPEKAE